MEEGYCLSGLEKCNHRCCKFCSTEIQKTCSFVCGFKDREECSRRISPEELVWRWLEGGDWGDWDDL